MIKMKKKSREPVEVGGATLTGSFILDFVVTLLKMLK